MGGAGAGPLGQPAASRRRRLLLGIGCLLISRAPLPAALAAPPPPHHANTAPTHASSNLNLAGGAVHPRRQPRASGTHRGHPLLRAAGGASAADVSLSVLGSHGLPAACRLPGVWLRDALSDDGALLPDAASGWRRLLPRASRRRNEGQQQRLRAAHGRSLLQGPLRAGYYMEGRCRMPASTCEGIR